MATKNTTERNYTKTFVNILFKLTFFVLGVIGVSFIFLYGFFNGFKNAIKESEKYISERMS